MEQRKLSVSKVIQRYLAEQQLNATQFTAQLNAALAPHDHLTGAWVRYWKTGDYLPNYWHLQHLYLHESATSPLYALAAEILEILYPERLAVLKREKEARCSTISSLA